MRMTVLILFILVTSCRTVESTHENIEGMIEYRYDKAMFTVFSWICVGESLSGIELDDSLKLTVVNKIGENLTETEIQRVKDYYTLLSDQHGWMFDYIATVFALNCSEPPAMRPWIAELREYGIAEGKLDKWTISKLEALAPLADTLNVFYSKAGLSEIMDEVADSYHKVNDFYKANAVKVITEAINYCRMSIHDIPSVGKIVVIPNLLGPLAEMGPEFMGVKYDVKGPGSSAGFSAHEFIHSIVHPVVSDSTASEIIRAVVMSMPDTVFSSRAWKSYPDPVIYFEECLVRSIDSRLTGYDIENELQKGFILCDKMESLLAEMEELEIGFMDFFPRILDEFRQMTAFPASL